MQSDTKKEFEKLNAKLEELSEATEGIRNSVVEEQKIEKIVEEKIYETKGIVYFILIIVAILLALVLGLLLRSFF